jgi:CBS domain containing-hemolysin-like protein
LSAPAILQLGRIASRPTPAEVSEDQKDDIVERAIESLAESAGISTPIIEEDEKEMIHQIFQLDVTEVEEIMIPRIDVIAIEAAAALGDIRDIIKKYGFSRYPVFEQNIDNIIGILKVKDLLTLDAQKLTDFELSNHIREPLRVGEHKKIDQLLADFKRTHIHMAIVMDEFGGTAGIVTLEDILEEIVGEIEDEHDTDKDRAVARRDDGVLEVSGAFPLEDLADELGLEIRREEFETVGGMIYDMVGSVPTEGTSLTWKNCKIKVLEVEGQRIKKVLVIPSLPPNHE